MVKNIMVIKWLMEFSIFLFRAIRFLQLILLKFLYMLSLCSLNVFSLVKKYTEHLFLTGN